MLSARKQLDVITAYRKVGTYRGAAEMCGVTHKTVKRIVERAEAAQQRVERRRNYESVRSLVAHEIDETKGKISAKRLLPTARAAGYAGSDRNFRRLVATERGKYRQAPGDRARSRRPAVWAPGEHLVIDWGVLNGLHVFCAVLAWSRVRFVRFADNERADTTLALLAECFATLGGVPKVVLADRMGCLKGGVVADVVVPTPDYVRFATHYRFRPDFCHAKDPQSKGIVENLVDYAKHDLMVPLGALGRSGSPTWQAANAAAAAWCDGGQRRPALGDRRGPRRSGWPRSSATCWRRCRRCCRRGCSAAGGSCARSTSCPASGSARPATRCRTGCSAPPSRSSPAATGVTIVACPAPARCWPTHPLMAPGEASVLDAHYGRPRPNAPARKVTARTAAEQAFCALGPVAEQWLRQAAASGNTRLGPELAELAALQAAHGRDALRRRAASGRSRSAGGTPAASGRSWPPAPASRSPPPPATRW